MMSPRRLRALLACLTPALACAPAPPPIPVTPSPVVAAETTTVPATPTPPPWRPATARLMTRWGSALTPENPLPEYPRPQMVRSRWANLNGLWEFRIVAESSTPGAPPSPIASVPGGEGPSGPLPLPPAGSFDMRILVPFAPEAPLSGVGRHADHVAYHRRFQRLPDDREDERLLLHFGACDWHCTVYVNDRQVADHTGGYDAFTVDITEALNAGNDQTLTVVVYDPTDKFGQPRGKQVSNPEGIWYTPVTGIWQTVWLEAVPSSSIARLRMTPDIPNAALRLVVTGRETGARHRVAAIASANGQEVGRAEGALDQELRIAVPNARLWSPNDPFLYDLRVTLMDEGREVDHVDSYFGMRSTRLMRDARGFTRIALNGQVVLPLGPLDQGWWPDGLYTAPSDEALRFDVEMTKALGFTMTRKHIKVEPARWYYHADRLGLPIWQDMPSGWNDSPAAQRHFERELRAMMEDLHNVPSIVAWVPFNEKWGQFDTKRIAGLVMQLDSSRLVNDASGWQHEDVGHIIDVHRYQGPQAMRGANGRVAVVGEFGGLGYKESGHAWAGDAWGYGGLFPSRDALAERYDLLLKRLYHDRDTHGIGAGVYTQMTDVEVELNGFFTYDRAVLKFDTARTAAVNRGIAPYITPELADFTDRVRVAIHQGTPTEIRYTVDGTEPTASSPIYRAPFTITRTTAVRARSFENGQPTSAPEARVDYTKGPGRAPETVAASALARGLDYAYYVESTPEPAFRMNWPVRWQVERPEVRPNDYPPRKSGVVTTPSLAPRDTTELFSLRYTGYVRVPRTGVYTFTARSDDGAALWVGDRNVFWSVGQSPRTTETWGQIALQAGLHPITLTYFQAYGPMALELLVEGPGLRQQPVPAGWFYRPRAGTPAR